MSAGEFQGWQAFYKINPFGSLRDNWHAALVASILHNANRKRNSPEAKMSEFFYVDAETARKKNEARMLSWLMANSVEKKANG